MTRRTPDARRADYQAFAERPDSVECPSCRHDTPVRWSHAEAVSRRTRCGECGAVFRTQFSATAGLWFVFPPERRTAPD